MGRERQVCSGDEIKRIGGMKFEEHSCCCKPRLVADNEQNET
jgi:hypothetical protein